MKKLLVILLISGTTYAQKAFDYPVAAEGTTQDVYFGTTTVNDPYRWLENDSLQATKDWVDKETTLSEKYLEGLKKKYGTEAQLRSYRPVYFGTATKDGPYYFDFLTMNTDEATCLFIKHELNERGENIVDPAMYRKKLSDKVSISEFSVSDDNNYIAFSLSYNGSDWNEIHVKTLYPCRKQKDVITGVKFSGIAWDKNGFYYVKYEQGREIYKDQMKNAEVWYHTLGTDQTDDHCIYKDTKYADAGIGIHKITAGNALIIYHRNAEGHKIVALDLNEPAETRKPDTLMAGKKLSDCYVVGMYKHKVLAYTEKDAPNGRLVFIEKGNHKLTEFVPQCKDVLKTAAIIGNKVVCTYLRDIDYICVTYDTTGYPIDKKLFPTGSTVEGFERNRDDTVTLFFTHSFVDPVTVYEYNVNTFKITNVKKSRVPYDFKRLKMEKVFYYSADSEKIPMIIAYKDSIKRMSNTPTLIYGYGGYGVVTTPFYSKGFVAFIESGGIVAVPCIRGGGEYGEKWHEKGKKLNKQNAFNDFIYAADYLVSQHYTSHKKIAIMGGSNGGLMVAAVANQRPDLCKAVIALKGVYDMLRYQRYTAGVAWENEYGVSTDSTDFYNLYKYSPLHNVKEAAYPATLVVTADHDDRVVPLHSYKYVAALQKKNKGNAPILMVVGNNMGHTDHDLDIDGDIYSFIYEQLGMQPEDLAISNYGK